MPGWACEPPSPAVSLSLRSSQKSMHLCPPPPPLTLSCPHLRRGSRDLKSDPFPGIPSKIYKETICLQFCLASPSLPLSGTFVRTQLGRSGFISSRRSCFSASSCTPRRSKGSSFLIFLLLDYLRTLIFPFPLHPELRLHYSRKRICCHMVIQPGEQNQNKPEADKYMLRAEITGRGTKGNWSSGASDKSLFLRPPILIYNREC